MAEILINFQGNETRIQCQTNEKLKDIFTKFANKIGKDINLIDFLYESTKINDELTFLQVANQRDLKINKMNITAYENNQNIVKSKEIICPECGENIRINLKDYKISLYECKNNHKIDNMLFNDFANSQKIDYSKILCSACKKDKNILYNKKFYKCNSCGIILCKKCKKKHNENHNIINYDKKNYKCEVHNERYSSYCKTCNKNLCILCEKPLINIK